jgi:plasmid maintenance system antidote protein VapI
MKLSKTKSSKKTTRKLKLEDSAPDVVYPGSLHGSGRKKMLLEFREIRKKITEKYSATDKLIFQLLQLKFQIEDYLKAENPATRYDFGHFLKEYIIRQNKNQAEFANDIGLDPSELSFTINNHRKPTDKLIFRLDIQSNKNFPARLWIKLMEKDRLYEIEQDNTLIAREESYVKEKLEFSL